MTIEVTDCGCTCCRRFSQFLFVSICDHFQMKRDFWQTFYLQYFSKHGENKQSTKKPSHIPLDVWFCGRWIIGRICLEIFDKNSGSEPRAFSFAIPAATMTVGLLPEETWKSFLMNHCPRFDGYIFRKGASGPGGKLLSVYRQNRRLQNGNLTNVW